MKTQVKLFHQDRMNFVNFLEASIEFEKNYENYEILDFFKICKAWEVENNYTPKIKENELK